MGELARNNTMINIICRHRLTLMFFEKNIIGSGHEAIKFICWIIHEYVSLNAHYVRTNNVPDDPCAFASYLSG